MHPFVKRLLEHPQIGRMAVHHQTVEGSPAEYAEPQQPLPRDLAGALAEREIERLYTHQARAIDITREGKDLLLVTPTASWYSSSQRKIPVSSQPNNLADCSVICS